MAGRVDKGFVVAADTIVVIDGDVLGKPSSREHARAMLETLSGRTHTVLTAVTVANVGSARSLSEYDSTELTLRELSPADLDWYLDTGEPMDKAGAYALQGEAVRFVTRVDGDRETVIGLPTRLVRRLLDQLL